MTLLKFTSTWGKKVNYFEDFRGFIVIFESNQKEVFYGETYKEQQIQ